MSRRIPIIMVLLFGLLLISCSVTTSDDIAVPSDLGMNSALAQQEQAQDSALENSNPSIQEELAPVPDFSGEKVNLEPYLLEDDGEPLFPVQDQETRLFGYINNKGEWVIEPQFYHVGTFQGGLVGVSFEEYGYYSPNKYLLNSLINKHGEVVYELPADYFFYGQFIITDGLIPIQTQILVDLPPERGPGSTTETYVGFMDASGSIVIPPVHRNKIGLFREGLVYYEPNCGYLDTKGNLTVKLPEGSRRGGEFHDSLAVLQDENQMYGYIDKQGLWVIEPVFEWAYSFSDGVAAAQQNGKWGLIDRTGDWVLEPSLDDITTGEWGSSNNRFSANLNGKWGAIDNTGQWVIEPNFQNVLYFFEGLSFATIEKNEGYTGYHRDPRHYGYIDQSGNWVIEPQYVMVGTFQNGLAYVIKDGVGGFIDREENWIWRYEHSSPSDMVLINH